MKSCDRRRNGLWLLFAWFHSCYDAPTRVSYLQQLFDSFLSLGNLFRILVDTIYLRVSWSFGLVIDWWLDREKKLRQRCQAARATKVSSASLHHQRKRLQVHLSKISFELINWLYQRHYNIYCLLHLVNDCCNSYIKRLFITIYTTRKDWFPSNYHKRVLKI